MQASPYHLVWRPRLSPRGAWGFLSDLVSLAKPKVLVLLLISTICPMVLAAGGDISASILFLVLLGGTLVSSSASAVNCVFEMDVDSVMKRTMNRPIPAGRLSREAGMMFALVTGASGLLLLSIWVGSLTALVALFGHFFYVLVYTMSLKRATPQNIVIGGAAGAIPPIVGWVAITHQLDLAALIMFLVVFLWTPPHFWALALNKNEDYKRANIPMLPVVKGEEETCWQMFLYSAVLFPFPLLLVGINEHLGWFSLTVFTLMGLWFVYKNYVLMKATDKVRPAWDVFGFSVLYLALFFFVMVIDSTII